MSVSVTTVLGHLTDPVLMNWFINKGKAACKKIGDEAKIIGSAVDAMVQEDIKGRPYLVPGEVLGFPKAAESIANCMRAWELFKKDHPGFVPSVKEMQTELVDGELVGHPDFIIEENHRWGIVDLKTSKQIQPNYWTQTGKYFHMASKGRIARGLVPGFIGILRLDKESGLYEYREITDESIIAYEITVFGAYWTLYQHSFKIREVLRQQLEEEVLRAA